MSSPAGVIESTLKEFWEKEGQPTSSWHKAFWLCHRIHNVWRGWRLYKTYTDRDNFWQLIAGNALNLAVGDKAFLRIAAHCVSIATMIMECIKQQVDAIRSFTNWKKVLFHPMTLPPRNRWHKKPLPPFMPPSLYHRCHFQGACVLVRSKQVASASQTFATALFKLSMRIMDAVDSLKFNPLEQRRSVSELFVNCSKWVEMLANDSDALIQGVERHQAVIESLLKKMHSQWGADKVVEVITKSAAAAKKGVELSKKVNKTAFDTVVDLFKQGTFGAMACVGLDSLLPRFMIPSFVPPWHTGDVGGRERFPARELLRRRFFPPQQEVKKSAKEIKVQAQIKAQEKTIKKFQRELFKANGIVYKENAPMLLPKRRKR